MLKANTPIPHFPHLQNIQVTRPQLVGKTAGSDLCKFPCDFCCKMCHFCIKYSNAVKRKMSAANPELRVSLQPLKMHCKSCALVTSSGHLLGGKQGDRIDEAECVIRMNDAPTRGYGRDVGNKTSLRVIAHSSIQRILRNRHELLNMSHGAVFIFWGPSSYMRRDGKGLVYNNLQLMNQILPRLKVYMISRHKMLQFDDLFKRETGKDRDPNHLSVPYHYYEPLGPDECTMYLSHERGRKGSHHRFITEKRVFENWARTFNIHFFQPHWKPEPRTVTRPETKPLL
ncbi:PREDICTED: alpha-N-acetylgalactosaminide alpha-2,6-sialyltransferase 5 isoform X2 [Lepidothrix coronata]|uniref:Alpha-N-acetylgalactosaminide alpha-2,6-sialyltransferase 5 isoform X2 n=1 Tax=Lepidothrix coronata TaxID=321398 RepID=A0A6J0I2P1_9PASS|nr:PREDICTED: alpha-N-acetylgalactosaminide alpha-2,6-sialyltransferase 5 isoform X2 [Lepidothrix coronata]